MRYFLSSSQIWYLYQRSLWCYGESWWDFSFHGDNLTRGLVILIKVTKAQVIKWYTSIN